MKSDDRPDVRALVNDYLDRRVSRREFFQRAAAVGLSTTAAAVILAACGTSGSTSTGGTSAAAPATSAAATSAPATSAAADTGAATEAASTEAASTEAASTEAAAPVKGGVLREGYDRDVSRIDPVGTSWWDATLFPATHETLVTADADGNFIPLLAEKWETSSDGLTWTFTLRSDLTFHSGAACDAAAVVAALDEIRTSGVNAGFWGPVTKLAAPDATTVVMTLKNPYADLPFVLNSGYSAIYNKAKRDELKDGYGVKGVDGTGPFTLGEYVAGSHVKLDRWDGYPGAGSADFFANKGTTYLDGIRFEVLMEPATRAQELEAGNLDALHGPAPQDVDRLKSNGDIAVLEFQEWGVYQLGVNFKKTDLGFDDVRVRQALSFAIDRQAIADKIFFGKAVPTYTLVPSAFPWYEQSVEQAVTYDPEKAKSLLEEAGFAGKISFKAIIEQDKVEQQVAQAVQQFLSDVGVKMELQVLGADYFEKASAGPEAFMIHNVWPYLFDASLLFAGSTYVPPQCCNWGFAKVAELDAAFADWQSAADATALEAAARKAQTAFVEAMPFISIVTPLNVWAHRQNVHGWVPTQPNLYPFYQDVWLETA